MNMAEPPTPQTLRGELKLNEPMARHVSWRAGGVAARTYAPADLDDLAVFLRTLSPTEGLYFCGLGSNLLVRDGGLNATVVFTHWALRHLRLLSTGTGESEIKIYAGAGVAAPKIARYAALHGAAGAEFLAGIPGTLGGALAMNAGCYGGETWDLVDSVTAIDRAGQLHERARGEYRIGYRTVVAPAQEWFVAARLRMASGDGEKSRIKIKELLSRRIASQPLQQPNAGSVFRNPPGDFAARLIEACGLKGARIGGAEISSKHANFIVNVAGAKAADIEALIELAQNSVREKFGVALEREVRIVGERA
ncbi:MAG: UDP-N-acetylmuramate dehydrogenase [Betaproteobacteria bacterium]|nr:UDP-N-acetylmuramate dehydrogenase [Betaproteobacteria bacterium]